MAGCAIGCLLGICRAIEKLVKGISSIEAELTKMNTKLEAAVAEIKKQINVAENVVKIIGLLDDAVAIAKKVVAGF